MTEPKTSQRTTGKMIVSSSFFGIGLATLLVPILAVLTAFSNHTMIFYASRGATPAQLEAQGTVGQWIAGDSASASALHRSLIIDRDIDQVHLVESMNAGSGTVEVHQNDYWITYKPGPTGRAIATVFAVLALILTAIISAMRFVIGIVRPFLKRRTPPRGFEILPSEMQVSASANDAGAEGR